jgi:hypothetical protein
MRKVMSENQRPRVLIVGAGSMGLITGYHLNQAGADITFLIRPHRKAELDRAQVLYCYDDNQLKDYAGYALITDPAEMIGAAYDWIVIALDAVALRSPVGRDLVETIGKAARGTDTKVILGAFFLNSVRWFLEVSGLSPEQVTNGLFSVQAYAPKAVTLPVHNSTDPVRLAKADVAYIHCFDYGFVVDDSAPAVANGFAELYGTSGVSRCVIKPAVQYAAELNPFFAVFAACEILDWPNLVDIDETTELWHLTVAAVKDIQRLSIHGDLGQQAAGGTTESNLAAALAGWEKAALPLNLQAFNRYHHGGKVNAQDRQHLRDCIALGAAEGHDMVALKELLERVERHTAVAA